MEDVNYMRFSLDGVNIIYQNTLGSNNEQIRKAIKSLDLGINDVLYMHTDTLSKPLRVLITSKMIS